MLRFPFLLLLTTCSSLFAAPRPNVLFIAIDDLNDWVGCLKGHPQAQTPNLDRLAARGVLFTEAHCASPLCKPSRTAVFTGRHPFQTGVYRNDDATIDARTPNVVLLPQAFASAGYRTMGTGKLLHSRSNDLFQDEFYTEQRWSPFSKRQVEYAKAELPSKGSANPVHRVRKGPGGKDYVLPRNRMPSDRAPDQRKGESFDWGGIDLPDTAFGDGAITDWAVKRVSRKTNKPFFLSVGYYRPHIPLWAPEVDFKRIPPAAEIEVPKPADADLSQLGPVGRRWALEAVTAGSHATVLKYNQWREAIRAYLACTSFVDRQIGRIVSALEESSYADNTWIVIWSDHGWHLGEKQHWGKWTGWRRSTRVPLIIVPPKGETLVARGRRCAQPVSLVDLYPTLLDLCGLPPGKDLAGVSLRPWLENPEADDAHPTVISTFGRGNYAIVGREWHYIRYEEGEEELYYLPGNVDRKNRHNAVRAKVHEGLLEKFRAALPKDAVPPATKAP